ncbi:MAG: hypothetical protein NTZ73_03790 [Candidatus Diapherotrites archaeon]|nr:hypothetical protein [Candidatus Diapherotrites archaeon]
MENGQGAIEYLLLLAAGVVVVAVVISFLIMLINQTQEAGCEGLKGMLCDSLDSNIEVCACYNGNEAYFGSPAEGKSYCCSQKCPKLRAKWNCGQ